MEIDKDTRILRDMLESDLVAEILSIYVESIILELVLTSAVSNLTREDNAEQEL